MTQTTTTTSPCSTGSLFTALCNSAHVTYEALHALAGALDTLAATAVQEAKSIDALVGALPDVQPASAGTGIMGAFASYQTQLREAKRMLLEQETAYDQLAEQAVSEAQMVRQVAAALPVPMLASAATIPAPETEQEHLVGPHSEGCGQAEVSGAPVSLWESSTCREAPQVQAEDGSATAPQPSACESEQTLQHSQDASEQAIAPEPVTGPHAAQDASEKPGEPTVALALSPAPEVTVEASSTEPVEETVQVAANPPAVLAENPAPLSPVALEQGTDATDTLAPLQPVAEVPADTEPGEKAEEVPSMRMKRDDLVALAESRGIDVPPGSTKKDILALLGY